MTTYKSNFKILKAIQQRIHKASNLFSSSLHDWPIGVSKTVNIHNYRNFVGTYDKSPYNNGTTTWEWSLSYNCTALIFCVAQEAFRGHWLIVERGICISLFISRPVYEHLPCLFLPFRLSIERGDCELWSGFWFGGAVRCFQSAFSRRALKEIACVIATLLVLKAFW